MRKFKTCRCFKTRQFFEKKKISYDINTLETHVDVWKDEQVCRNGSDCVWKDEQVCRNGIDCVSARAHRRVETRSAAHYDSVTACHTHTYTHAPFAASIRRRTAG
ncbi:hypothetical protein QTP88_018422 [Uroleucon formosanum]